MFRGEGKTRRRRGAALLEFLSRMLFVDLLLQPQVNELINLRLITV
jgi:hypothetical protein